MVKIVDKEALKIVTRALLELLGYPGELPASTDSPDVLVITVNSSGKYTLSLSPFGPIIEDSIN